MISRTGYRKWVENLDKWSEILGEISKNSEFLENSQYFSDENNWSSQNSLKPPKKITRNEWKLHISRKYHENPWKSQTCAKISLIWDVNAISNAIIHCVYLVASLFIMLQFWHFQWLWPHSIFGSWACNIFALYFIGTLKKKRSWVTSWSCRDKRSATSWEIVWEIN